MIAASSMSGHHRLEQLYEVCKLFNAFASVDETVGKALQVVAATLPLESALLIHAGIASHTEITVWRCEDNAPAGLVAARAHAEALYTYLVGARSVDTLDVRDRAGSATLPVPRDRRIATAPTRRFIMIPLVVARGMVFGALQLEAASEPSRDDVEFVNALANQLAIALDRDRIRRHDVVRRREAQLSRARYENVVDRLDAAFVWEADLESHRISYVSAQFEPLVGFSRRECLDERNWWRSHVHPDDRDLLEHTFARALAERGSQRCDHRVIASDHAILWLHTSVHVADVPGEAPRLQGLSCEITAAKIEQDRVRDQLSFASAVMASLGEGTIVVDLDGAITFINDAGASLLRGSGEEVLGRPTADVARVVDREGTALECPLAIAMRTGAGVRSDDHLILRADGSRFRASYAAAPVRRDGCVIGAVLEFHDITERGAAEDDERFLLDAGTTLSASLESAKVANAIARLGALGIGDICVVDLVSAEGPPRCVAWAHRDPSAQGELDRAFGGAQHVKLLSTPVNDVIATGRSRLLAIDSGGWLSSPELVVAQHLGARSALVVPFVLGGRRLGALTLVWFVDRRRGDREIALAEQFARRCAPAIEHAGLHDDACRAVAVREQALAIVSHELKSPLVTIALASEILGDDDLAGRDPGARSVAVAAIQRATGRMDRVICDLLDFASIEAGGCAMVTSPQDVSSIIADSTASFEQMATRCGVRLVGETPVDMPAIRCDRDRILQVIANLLSNALHVVSRRGSVSLRVKQRENEAVFSVADTGPGIEPAKHAHLFERYWRSPQASYPGIGLGLAIARGIVERHGGRIWADSELGHGATFFFTMPFATVPALPADSRREDSQ